jgi:predicted AlkP superfamily pyrophosphatase or phosphodiesterase
VVVISVDGLRPDALFHAETPTLQALACRGAYSWQATTIALSYTVPAHASMLSGFLPEAHGLFNDDLRPGFIAVPTVMTAAHRAGKRVVLVVGKEKLVQLAPPADYDVFVSAAPRDADVIARALERLPAGFDLLFVHLPEVDLVGHAVGWMSNAYLAQVARTDRLLAGLLQALPPDATVILTADHGGSGYIHWSGRSEDQHIPWIAAGPGIRPGRALQAPVNTLDTAATVAQLLGIALPPEAPGRALMEPWAP